MPILFPTSCSVSSLIMVDDLARVRPLLAGYPT